MMANIGPIKPDEVEKNKEASIPDVVFEAFNELITKKFSGGSAVIYQSDVVELMVQKGLEAKDIYENHWLDVEGVYRKAGWKVEYDKPAWCETYEAHFIFKK